MTARSSYKRSAQMQQVCISKQKKQTEIGSDGYDEEAEEGIDSDHYCSGIGDRFAVYPGERIRAVRTVYDSVFGNRI